MLTTTSAILIHWVHKKHRHYTITRFWSFDQQVCMMYTQDTKATPTNKTTMFHKIPDSKGSKSREVCGRLYVPIGTLHQCGPARQVVHVVLDDLVMCTILQSYVDINYTNYCNQCHPFYLSSSTLNANRLRSVNNTKCRPNIVCHIREKVYGR